MAIKYLEDVIGEKPTMIPIAGYNFKKKVAKGFKVKTGFYTIYRKRHYVVYTANFCEPALFYIITKRERLYIR